MEIQASFVAMQTSFFSLNPKHYLYLLTVTTLKIALEIDWLFTHSFWNQFVNPLHCEYTHNMWYTEAGHANESTGMASEGNYHSKVITNSQFIRPINLPALLNTNVILQLINLNMLCYENREILVMKIENRHDVTKECRTKQQEDHKHGM